MRMRSFLSLDHDDVVSKLRLDWGVGVGRIAKTGYGEGKCSLLEGANHRTSGLQMLLLKIEKNTRYLIR